MIPEFSSWELVEGIAIARRLEAFCAPLGFHVALGGSVLHKGISTKDLDIFIYPHHTDTENEPDFHSLRQKMLMAGEVTDLKALNFKYDRKEVFQGSIGTRRVDLFFLT